MSTPSVAEVVVQLHEFMAACRDQATVNAITLATNALERTETARVETKRERDAAFAMSKCECSSSECCANLVKHIERAETAERELAALRNRPCPYVHSSREGTHYCTLPHAAEKELAELRKRVAEAPMVTFRLGYAEGLFEVDSAQEDHLVPTGQRVAIVPLREGE